MKSLANATFARKLRASKPSNALRLLVLTPLLLAPLPAQLAAQQPPDSLRAEAPAQTLEQRQQLERRIRARLAGAARRAEMRGQPENALKAWRELREEIPGDEQALEGIRRNLVDLGRYAEAAQLLRERLEAPVRAPFQRATQLAQLGALLYRMGDEAGAEAAWQRALSVAGERSSGYYAVASEQLRLQLLDEAVELFHQGRREIGDSTLFAANLASLHLARMEWTEAAREYLRSLRSNSSRLAATRRGLAALPADSAVVAEVAEVFVRELEAVDDQGSWPGYTQSVRELLVDQYRLVGNYRAALQLVAIIDRESEAPGRRLLQFAGELMEQEEYAQAERALQLAAERFGDSGGAAVATIARAELAARRQHAAEADSLLTGVLARPQLPSQLRDQALWRRAVVRLELLGDLAAAESDLVRLLATPSAGERLEVHYLYAELLARRGAFDEASEQLAELQQRLREQLRRSPHLPETERETNAEAVLLAARIELWRGQLEQARATLDSALSPPRGASAENEALLLLGLLSGAAPEDSLALPLFARADSADHAGSGELAAALYDSVARVGKGRLATEAAWRAALLRMEEAGGNTEPVRSFAEEHQGTARAEEAMLLLGRYHQRRGEREQAVAVYEELLLRYPEGLLAASARGRLDELAGIELPPLAPAPSIEGPPDDPLNEAVDEP